MRARLTILGSGTSTGIPTIGCACAVCTSTDPRDQRLRPSVWLQWDGHDVLIDTTPDLRLQALRSGMRRLDAVLFTHAHADHVMGMDDLRPFCFAREEPLPVYGSSETVAAIRRIFAYAFEGADPGASPPRVVTHALSGAVKLYGQEFEPLPVRHGEVDVLGYRFGANAYVTDFSQIPAATMERLRGLDVLILDALRLRPHPNHSNLENSLRLAEELKPKRVFFTHLAHELPHAATEAGLPPPIRIAYDGLELELEL